MTNVIQIDGWRARKAADIAAAAPLECPTCDSLCVVINVESDGATAYRCVGNGHRALTWRINANGDMLRGLKGNRYY